MQKNLVDDDVTIRGTKIATMAREADSHLARVVLLIDTLSSVLKSNTVEEILKALADLFKPYVKIVVTSQAQNSACPNDDIKPILWMLVQTQIRSTRAVRDDWSAAQVYVTLALVDHDCCQIVIGPDERERGPEWEDVTERACGKGGWLSDVAVALRAGGQDLVVRSNGPLAEMTIRWS